MFSVKFGNWYIAKMHRVTNRPHSELQQQHPQNFPVYLSLYTDYAFRTNCYKMAELECHNMVTVCIMHNAAEIKLCKENVLIIKYQSY
jgi:hypothetical protein